ncbi:MAG: ABC transporter ATP-binding protein [Gammaproteobacteria bacterium]|nr:ABC transporter ATP-binding protein [Gammaproteobacteria bacterium]
MLEAIDIAVSFGGVHAVQGLSFKVDEREIFSIMGPNGAGKTTVFNAISRFYDLDTGTISFEDEDISRVAPHVVARKGIARTFQNVELFDHETVLQNLLIAQHTRRRTTLLSEVLFLPKVRKQEIDFRRKAEDIIDLLHLQSYRDQTVDSLPFGIRKIVEVGRALCLDPKLLLLDEPSSGLNPEESEDLSFWITDINEDLGITIMMVEHDMNLIGQVSNRVMVMADGKHIVTGTPSEVSDHPDVVEAYLGT